ncbi:hypothetical protein OG851_42650 (plasmid) [Streptomyces sp. NBC_00161]|uniref:hypothetical protein n=1 Tax=Streptomyces sp. NBC_00161 TaxID=2975671 RepID=UPI002F911757
MTEPFITSLDPYEWDSEGAVAYEAAVEAINGVVGAYSALIAQEREQAEPDTAQISEWRQRQAECQQVRMGIDPGDRGRVRAVRDEYGTRLRSLRELMAR